MPRDYAHRAAPKPERVNWRRLWRRSVIMMFIFSGLLGSGYVAKHRDELTSWWQPQSHHAPALTFYQGLEEDVGRQRHLALTLPLVDDEKRFEEMQALCHHAGVPVLTSQVWWQGRWWYRLDVGPFAHVRALYEAQRRLLSVGLMGKMRHVA